MWPPPLGAVPVNPAGRAEILSSATRPANSDQPPLHQNKGSTSPWGSAPPAHSTSLRVADGKGEEERLQWVQESNPAWICCDSQFSPSLWADTSLLPSLSRHRNLCRMFYKLCKGAAGAGLIQWGGNLELRVTGTGSAHPSWGQNQSRAGWAGQNGP